MNKLFFITGFLAILCQLSADQLIAEQEGPAAKTFPEDWASPDTLAAAVYSWSRGRPVKLETGIDIEPSSSTAHPSQPSATPKRA